MQRRPQAGPYSGYYHRPPVEDDFLLTKVGPGTPCGEYLRRYWHPFLIAAELKDLPLPVRLLGEDLVVFRDGSGRLGLLHRHCAHRGTSLEFGIPAERGIRCCYHGWHFDVDGTILDTPAEPAGSRIKQNFCQGAYRVRESQGLLFAYMGPPDAAPELPVYDTVGHPAGNKVVPVRMNLPCNWLQIVENAADPIHNAFLHAIVSGQQFSAAFKVLPQLDFPETPLGFLSMATRKVKDYLFVRASDIILPNVGQFPSGGNAAEQESFGVRPFLTRWAVPVDDTRSFYIGYCHLNDYNHSWIRSVDPADYGVDKIPFIGQTGDRPYEERQREPGDYDAVASQGPIANRKAEHLGTADRGVVLFRRMLAKAIAATQAGEAPAVPRRYAGGPVRTYAHEAVLRLPPDAKLDDPKALAAVGRRVAEIFIGTDDLPPAERDKVAEQRIRRLFETATAS
jgi:phenylpropionate dioxygenase-like ring-hydroxylating dioxygenase large terminal subunit